MAQLGYAVSMMDLNEIQYFTWVATMGSFSAAARQAGIPKSTLSRKVSDLEKRLGVTLLRRTTRQLKLTDVGNAYLQICTKALSELESAQNVASETQLNPSGKLRIAAPVEMGSMMLADIATEFTQKYPEVELEFVLNDSIADLIEEKIDVAIRAGALPDSSLIAQKVTNSELQLLASPAYLKKYGEPKSPKDLENHRLIVYPNLAEGGFWQLEKGNVKHKVYLKNKIVANQLSMVRTLVASGAGIALLPMFVGFEEEFKKSMVRVLPTCSSDRDPVHIVYVKQDFIPHRTRLFIEFLKKAFN